MKNASYLLRKIVLCICVLQIVSFTHAQQVAKSLTASNGTFIGFYEYKPVDYNDNLSVKYPLIIFLHGIGERGNGTTDLAKVRANAIPKYINRGHKMRFYWNGKWETFLVLSPQLSTKYGSWPSFYVEEMIEYAKKNLRIDTNRIILTGLSLGGGGVWTYATSAAANAQKLACIAPVCGTCTMSNASYITNTNLPVWAFHAKNDPRVSVNCTNNSIAKIESYNPAVKPIKTLYDDGGHVIWDRAFDTTYKWQEPNIFEWFLGQNKSLPPNILPVARAGSAMIINSKSGIATLNGTGSSDRDGKIVKYIWKKISGPAAVTIASPGNASASVSGLTTDGEYRFELTVVDNRTGWTKDTVKIIASSQQPSPNKAPISKAGEDIIITLPLNHITLDGSASSDPDGSISAYQWTRLSGPAGYAFGDATAAVNTVSGLQGGTYVFVLEVTDNNGSTDHDSVIVVVKPAVNRLPVAKAGSNITITLPVNSTTLTGTASEDPDGTISFYEWTKIGGPNSYTIAEKNSAVTGISDLVQGTYQFQLEIRDNKGGMARDTVAVIVKPEIRQPNIAPSASAGKDIVLNLPRSEVMLNGSDSRDPDGVITIFSWTYIGGPAPASITSPSEASTSVSSLVEGEYVFELTVRDDDGAIDRDTVKVIVNPAPNRKPVADAGTDITVTLPVDSAILNGSASSDPDGTISSFEWSRISGPADYKIANPSAAKTELSHLAEGIYYFGLKITDNNGVTDMDTVKISVRPAPNKNPLARAGADITITLPVNSATLNGSSSVDTDGTISAFNWSRISGPSNYKIANPSAAKTGLSNLSEGKYVFELKVTDNNGSAGSDRVMVTVMPKPNESPVADAGSDMILTMPTGSVLLDASASYDPDGKVAAYSWTKISGPGGLTIVNATTVKPTVVGLNEGKYIFRLTVIDDHKAQTSDDVAVTVLSKPNEAPHADAGKDTIVGYPGHRAILDGSASFDDDGTITAYSWTQLSGPVPAISQKAGARIFETGDLLPGDYIFELSVEDDKGAIAKDSMKLTVVSNYRYEEKISVYPNPASAMLHVNCTSDSMGVIKMNIYDLAGHNILTISGEKKGPSFIQDINVSAWKAGIYFVEINIDGKKRMISKILKQ